MISDLSNASRIHWHTIQIQKMATVSTLARGIAHEFNNLHGIVTELLEINLRNNRLPPALREDMETMHRTICRAVEITDNIVSFARKKPSLRVPVDINRIVMDTFKMMRGELESEGIRVNLIFSQGGSQLLLDEALISHVILELIMNAQQAMLESKAKTLTIKTGLSNGHAFVMVSDTGCGISDEHIEQMFDPFFTRGKRIGSAKGRGRRPSTGLGLSICHAIVEEQGGRIDVETKLGKGTTFTVWLPVETTKTKCGKQLVSEQAPGSS